MVVGNYTYDQSGAKRVKATTTGSERTRVSIALCAAADGYKLPIVAIVPRVNSLKDLLFQIMWLSYTKQNQLLTQKLLKNLLLNEPLYHIIGCGELENLF